MMSQPIVAVQQVQAPSSLPIYHNYKHKQALAMGIIQILMGVGSIIFQIAAMVVGSYLSYMAPGIYCGVFFILAGSFGIASSASKTSCLIATCMVFSVLSVVLTIDLLAVSANGAALDSLLNNRGGYYTTEQHHNRVGMNLVLVVIAVIEAIAAIWASAICCQVVCCGRIQSQQGPVYYNEAGPTGHVAAPQMVMVNQGQPYYVQQGDVMVSMPPQAQAQPPTGVPMKS